MSYINQVNNGKNIEEYKQETDNKTESKKESQKTAILESDNDALSLTNEITEKLNEFSSQIKTIEDVDSSSISGAFSKIQNLKSNISIYTSQIAYLDEQISLKQTQIDEITEKLEKVQKEYEEIEEELEEKQKKLEETNSKIEKINKQIEKQKKIVDNADSNSSEDEIKSACSKLSAYYSQLSTLYSEKANLEEAISTLNSELESKANTISQYQNQISALDNTVSELSTNKSNIESEKTTAEEELNNSMLSIVSEAEWQLVKENNIDLTEKLENGEPRYIFAQGQSDETYHIYDMSVGSSLARMYCPGGGYDIVSTGNGNINGFTKKDDGTGSTVFYMDDCDTLCEFNACYSTCSPLSLDINGDGIKTSETIINYDIDGDGILDKINDSADAVLVFDKDGNGISGEDGSECFGNNTDLDGDGIKDGFKDGFEALKELAKQNNLINGKDDNVLDSKDIAFLEENFGLKLKLNGYGSEAVSLKDAGITEINLGTTDETTLIDNFDGQGNQLMKQEGATFTINGETKEYADIWHKKILTDVEKAAEIFAGDSLSFSMNGFLVNNNFITTAKTVSSSSNEEGLEEINDIKKEAKAKIKEIKNNKK